MTAPTPRRIHDVEQAVAAGRDMARLFAAFYLELLAQAVAPGEALQMTLTYIQRLHAAAGAAPTGDTPMSPALEPGRCRGCQADILWARTPTGRKVPLNATPEKRFIVLPATEDCAVMVETYLSHFATCPDAARFRAKGLHIPPDQEVPG